jgi:hypothetical protein
MTAENRESKHTDCIDGVMSENLFHPTPEVLKAISSSLVGLEKRVSYIPLIVNIFES